MDTVNAEAIANLKTTIQGLLPAPSAQGFASDVVITQADVMPVGVSGIIGHSIDPAGEILGRRIKATLSIAVKAADAKKLVANFEKSINTLLSFGHGELRQQGVLKLSMDKPGEVLQDNPATRELNIKVVYEYQKSPETAEGVIESIPVNLS